MAANTTLGQMEAQLLLDRRESVERIEVLREMTKALSPTPLLALVGDKYGAVTEYNTEQGTCIGFALFSDVKRRVSIQRAFMTRTAKLTRHVHDGCAEIIGVYRGGLTFTFDDGETNLVEENGVIVIPPGRDHCVEAWDESDVWMWAVTMPADQGYPGTIVEFGSHR